ncbi:hypothetical protein PVA44_07335 (plasmid) [Entomospira nematocerorum]|uniref:Lipoprotein n=1 Tax=Entomospira nematocerorum TaxID=2719987 RepID=A0A968GD95_9SPIO|nr:hypothetical protein [Entomospira nematocera]NIZ47722.1 hypothetical protein [Entomospira nematocera]WDI34649.1 hypothetical protein PVA44_07335 [Entomospira nematocera]
MKNFFSFLCLFLLIALAVGCDPTKKALKSGEQIFTMPKSPISPIKVKENQENIFGFTFIIYAVGHWNIDRFLDIVDADEPYTINIHNGESDTVTAWTDKLDASYYSGIHTTWKTVVPTHQLQFMDHRLTLNFTNKTLKIGSKKEDLSSYFPKNNTISHASLDKEHRNFFQIGEQYYLVWVCKLQVVKDPIFNTLPIHLNKAWQKTEAFLVTIVE